MIKSVQKGEATILAGNLDTDVTITSVNRAKSFVTCSSRAQDAEETPTVVLNYDYNINFTRENAFSYDQVIAWFVVEFK